MQYIHIHSLAYAENPLFGVKHGKNRIFLRGVLFQEDSTIAYYDTIYLVAGDDKPELNFVLRDSNTAASGLNLDPEDSSTWAIIDISDPTIVVKFRKLGTSTTLDTMVCTKVAPYTDGACYMNWNPTTLDVAAGTYEGEIELTYTSGRVMTLYDLLKFKVRGDFA